MLICSFSPTFLLTFARNNIENSSQPNTVILKVSYTSTNNTNITEKEKRVAGK